MSDGTRPTRLTPPGPSALRPPAPHAREARPASGPLTTNVATNVATGVTTGVLRDVRDELAGLNRTIDAMVAEVASLREVIERLADKPPSAAREATEETPEEPDTPLPLVRMAYDEPPFRDARVTTRPASGDDLEARVVKLERQVRKLRRRKGVAP